MVVTLEDFLEHHGVKGMKWGIRNKMPKKTAKEVKARNKRAKAATNRRTLSDGDIQKYINRLNEEKKLKTLVNEDLKPGRSAAKKILSTSGQRVATTVISGAAIVVVKAAVEKKMAPKGTKVKLDPKQVADTIARGGLKKH